MRSARTVRLAIVLTALAPAARADGWLVAETPAAMAVSDAQQGVFRPGVMPAVGLYADNGWLATGVRLRMGLLRNGPAPGEHLQDPGLGGLTTASLALRVHRGGAWIEAVAGGGLTGMDLLPALELGAGWSYPMDSLDIGPSARIVRVVSQDSMDSLGSADLLVVGIDVKFGRDHRRALPRSIATIAPVATILTAVKLASAPLSIDRDVDIVIEREASCARELDGCPIADAITIIDDRIILDERVLFDLDRARVRTRGKLIVRAIAELWAAHPEWKRITIEGHADARGSDDYNLGLSQLRADRVRAVLIEGGAGADRVDAIGHGRARPRDTGSSEPAHQRNRRVEFVIDRQTTGGTP